MLRMFTLGCAYTLKTHIVKKNITFIAFFFIELARFDISSFDEYFCRYPLFDVRPAVIFTLPNELPHWSL